MEREYVSPFPQSATQNSGHYTRNKPKTTKQGGRRQTGRATWATRSTGSEFPRFCFALCIPTERHRGWQPRNATGHGVGRGVPRKICSNPRTRRGAPTKIHILIQHHSVPGIQHTQNTAALPPSTSALSRGAAYRRKSRAPSCCSPLNANLHSATNREPRTPFLFRSYCRRYFIGIMRGCRMQLG